MFLPRSLSLLFTLAASSIVAQADTQDPIADGLREAARLHQSGKSDELVAKLKEISKLVEQNRNQRLANRLPDRLGDWVAAPLKNEDLALLGGGNTMSREYSLANRKIVVRVIKDSPLAKGIGSLLSNEALLAMSKRKTEKIGGLTAVFDGERKLQMVPAENLFLELEGNEPTRSSDIVALARKLDVRSLANFTKKNPTSKVE